MKKRRDESETGVFHDPVCGSDEGMIDTVAPIRG